MGVHLAQAIEVSVLRASVEAVGSLPALARRAPSVPERWLPGPEPPSTTKDGEHEGGT